MFPVLLVLTSREQWYPQFFIVARFWAKIVLYGCGFVPKLTKEAEVDRKKSYMFVANHTSMTDIMLMLYCVKNPFVFVGKKELAKIPIFGFFYKRTCILVDRSSQKSRKEVFDRAHARLHHGTSICIFPEGGVPDDETIVLDTFKDGAFRLAIDHQIPILPLVFFDNKKRFSYNFFSGGPGRMRAHILSEIPTEGLTQENKKELKGRIYNIILEALQKSS
ncbi:lysophospholipid acyltransferase family protein [Aquimarina gracilis]